MKKLVIEIDLDTVEGSKDEIVPILFDMIDGIFRFPENDVRIEGVHGFLSSRIIHEDKKELLPKNVIASVDVVEGEMAHTDIDVGVYHERERS